MICTLPESKFELGAKIMHKAIIYITAVCIVAVSTLSAAAQTTSGGIVAMVANSTDERYKIGYQDVVEVQVFNQAKLTLRQTVSIEGTIRLVNLRDTIVAVCKTERQLARDIENAYQKEYLKNPQVTVTVVEQKSQPVSIIGAVEKPGTYYIGRKMHLLEILALAAGPSKEAGSRMLVARTGGSPTCQEKGSEAETEMSLRSFKIKDVQEGKATMKIEPGDIVSILPVDYVYVYGNVTDPGQIPVREPITVTQAIASSKGLKSATDKGDIRILRQKADSLEREEIMVDLTAIEKGRAKDPYLEPNDIVAVSRDGTKAIMNGFVKALTSGLPTLIRPY